MTTFHKLGNVGVGGLPSEAQFVLLFLDYLHGLYQSYVRGDDLRMTEGLHADYISILIYALSRAFLRPNQLVTACQRQRDCDDEKCDNDVELGDDNKLQVDEVAVNAAGHDSYFDPVINTLPEYFSEGGIAVLTVARRNAKKIKKVTWEVKRSTRENCLIFQVWNILIVKYFTTEILAAFCMHIAKKEAISKYFGKYATIQ
eukprot:10503715-Ditylum_brightwellii.AAC.1